MDKRQILIKKLVLTAFLTSLVILLQMLGQFFRVGVFSISLVLLPIVIGAILGGVKVSTWLGFVFSVVVLFNDSSAFFAINAVGTVVVVLLKGILAGLISGLIFKLFKRFNLYLAVILTALICPIINTGIFVLGCYIFFFSAISEWGIKAGSATTFEYVLLVLVGFNFLIEIGVNIFLSPIIIRIINIKKIDLAKT